MRAKGARRFASARCLSAIALLLGCLCRHSLALSSSPTFAANDVFTGGNLLARSRDILSARGDDAAGQPGPSLFEQAFTATYNSKEPDQVTRTLTQYAQLVSFVERTPSLNATQMAFLPELASAAALDIVRAAVRLYRGNSTDAASLAASLVGIARQLRAAAGAAPWRGFAATRRALLGAILKKRVLDFRGRFPPNVDAAADALLLQLFQLHKASAAARGAVQFFHVSKSGGTNLCQAAGANGCASLGFDTRTNCLIRDFSDQPRWVSYNAHKFLQTRMSSRQGLPWFVNFHSFRPSYSCAQRRAYLLRDGLTFYANEYTNPPGPETTTATTATGIATASETITTSAANTTATGNGDGAVAVDSVAAVAAAAMAGGPSSTMCEQDFVNLLMVRHPYDRLKSQIGWVQKLYKEYYLDVDTQPAFLNRTSGFWERLMPAGVNNYYVRSLLGHRFFEFPVLEVAPAHLDLAKLAALQHDILLVLEEKGRSEAALRLGLGWGAAGLRDGAVRSSAELGDEVALPLDYDAMLRRNAPDVELYGFAREMQALDAMLWNYAAAADRRAGGALVGNSGGGGGGGDAQAACGYVTMGSPEAAAALQERLRGVELPPKAAALGGGGGAAAAVAADGGGVDAAAAAAGGVSGRAVGGGFSGSRFGDAPAAADDAGGGVTAAAPGGGASGGRGPSVVSISRHHQHRRGGRRLLRLKTLQAWGRQRGRR